MIKNDEIERTIHVLLQNFINPYQKTSKNLIVSSEYQCAKYEYFKTLISLLFSTVINTAT